MSELDPLTNLPKNDPEPTPAKIGTPKGKSSLDELRRSHRALGSLRGGEGRTVQGTFGDYAPGANIVSNKNFNQIRAQGQSGLELFGKSLAQAGGAVVGMGLEVVGFLGEDIPQAITHMATGSEMEFERNFISQMGNDIEEWTQDQFQVYTTDEVNNGEFGRFFDATYWASLAPSIASTLSIMLPAGSIGRGAAYAARAFRAGKWGTRVAATVGSAVSSRHMEGMLEAYESYEQNYDKAINEGRSELEANTIASQEAAGTYRRGYINLVTDMFQWGALSRGLYFSNRAMKSSIIDISEKSGDDLVKAVGNVLKRNPSLTYKQAVQKAGFDWKDWVGQSVLEGYEEFNQEFIKRIASHNADVSLGLTDGRAMGFGEAIGSSLMSEHLQDPKTWDAALMGFIGGAVFQGVGGAYASYQNRGLEADMAMNMKAEQEKLGYIQETVKNINASIQTGDTQKAEIERQNLVFSLAINGMNTKDVTFGGAAIEGRMGNTIEMFEAIKNMTEEERANFGLGEESVELADKVIKDLQSIGDNLNKFFNETNVSKELDGPLAIMKAEQTYRIDKAIEMESDIDGKISEILSDGTTGKIYESLDTNQQSLFQEIIELESLQKTKKFLEEAPEDAYGAPEYRISMFKKGKAKAVARIDERIKEISEAINGKVERGKASKLVNEADVSSIDDQDVSGIMSNEDVQGVQDILKNMEDNELHRLYEARAENTTAIEMSKINLQELNKKGVHESIIDAMGKTSEKLQREYTERVIENKYRGGEMLLFEREDKEGETKIDFGRIFYPEEGVVAILPVDREGKTIGDIARVDKLKELKRIAKASAVDYDQMMSTEAFEIFQKEFRKNLKNGNFEQAFAFISDRLAESNYSDKMQGLKQELLDGFGEYINDIDSAGELISIYNSFLDFMPPTQLAEARDILQTRIEELQDQINDEIESISKSITRKVKDFRKLQEKVTEAEETTEQFKQDASARINEIFDELVEQEAKEELTNLDRRTKPAKAIEALEREMKEVEKDLKNVKKTIEREQAQILKDIKTLQKLADKVVDDKMSADMILDKEMKEIFSEMEYIKSRLLLNSNMTIETLDGLSSDYEELSASVERAITAIEKFREYTQEINDASGVIRKATRKAYNELLEEGLLSQTSSVFGDVGKQIFEAFRIKFNKNLTSELQNLNPESYGNRFEGVRKLINETRITSNNFPGDVNYWAAFDIDYPIFSELFQSSEMAELLNARNDIQRFIDLRSKYETYQGVLKRYQHILRNRAVAVKGRTVKGKKSTKEDTDTVEDFKPQRTIFTAFKRLAGNSGTNDKPNPDASQRRLYRYITNTSFKDNPHFVELMLAPDNYDVPEYYKRDEVILAAVTDENRNYLKEDGTTTETFSLEENLYSTITEPSYTIPGSKYDRTFKPTPDYLKNHFAGKNYKERKANYEKEKERIKQTYAKRRNKWLADLRDGKEIKLGINGKSMGIDYIDLDNPQPLETMFDVEQVDLRVQTREVFEYKGDLVHFKRGHVVILDNERGNAHEGHTRNLNAKEKNTIIAALRQYANQSEFKGKKANYNKELRERAGRLQDAEGNVLSKPAFEVVKDLIYSFEDNAYLELMGNEMRVGDQIIPIYAENADGEFINKLNPELENALVEVLDGTHIQVQSAPLKNSDETYYQIIYEDGQFKETEYPSYKQYLLDNKVVQTYLQKPPKLENGEEGFRSYNQSLVISDKALDLGQSEFTLDDADSTPPPTEEDSGPTEVDLAVEGEIISDISQINNKEVIVEYTGAAIPLRVKVTNIDGNIDTEILSYDLENATDSIKKTFDVITKNAEKRNKLFTSWLNDGDKFKLIEDLQTFEIQKEETTEVPEPEESTIADPEVVDAYQIETPGKEESEYYDKIEKKSDKKDDATFDWFKGTASGRVLTNREFDIITGNLTSATGVPVVVKSKVEGLEFLQEHSDEKFTLENLPKGAYHRGIAYVFTDGEINSETVFHEVGHAIVDQIMDQNPELARELYNSIASTAQGRRIIEQVEAGYGDAFPNNVADPAVVGEIITTVLGKEASNQYQDKGTLQKIWDAIRNFFQEIFGESIRVNELNATTSIKDLAKILSEGRDIQLTPTLINRNTLRLQKADDLVLNDSVKFTSDTMDMMNYLFFDNLFNVFPDKLNILFTSDDSKEYYNEVLKAVKADVLVRRNTAVKQLKERKAKGKLISKEHTNFIDNLDFVRNNWDKVISLHQRNLKRYNIEVITEDTIGDSVTKDSNKYYQDASINFSAKQNATSAVRFLVGSLSSHKANFSFPGIKKNVDFGKVFNVLANHMAGTTTLAEKRDVITQKIRHQEGMTDLLNRTFMKSGFTKADINLMLQFNEAFSKHNNSYKIAISDEGDSFKLIDATINTSKNRLVKEWFSNSIRQNVYTLKNNQLVYKPSLVNSLKQKDLLLTSLNKNYQERLTKRAPNEEAQYKSYYKRLQFLEKLGIHVTAYDSLPSEEFNNSVDHMYNLIKKGKGINAFLRDGDMEGDLNAVVQHEIDNSVDWVENQHLNLENETVYNVTLNHYISLIEDKINRAANLNTLLDENPHLKSDYSKRSILLNRKGTSTPRHTKLFNKDGERTGKLTINITEGIKGNRKATPFGKLDHSDKIRVHINSVLSGQYPLFRAGDKKLERFIELGEIFSKKEIRENTYVKQFTEYLMDELDYIRKNRDLLSQYAGAQNLVENPIENSIMPKMVSGNKKLKTAMEKYIDGNLSAMTQTMFSTAEHQIKKHFEDMIPETIDYLEEFMVVEKQGDSYKNNGLLGLVDNDMVKYNQEQLENIIKTVVISEAAANIEQTKVFTGHPAFYKKSDNFFHRMSGALGTKKISSVGNGVNNLLNQFFPSNQRLYAYTDSKGRLQTTDKYEKGYRPIIRTAVFSDVITRSTELEEIKKTLKNADSYETMEEADAIGMVSLETYRDMKLRGAEWTEALERLYQWEKRPERATSIQFENWTTGETEKVTARDLVNTDGKRTTFNMLKPQYFGPLAEEEFIPGMYKTALLPVLREYNTPAFTTLKEYMSKSKTGIVTFESANKVGTKNPGQELYKDGVPDFSEVTTQDSYFEYWGLQLQTGNSVKDRVILGSQFMKQILSGIYENGEVRSDKAAELGDLASEMTRTHSDLIQLGIDELIEELGLTIVEGRYTIDSMESLIDFLVDEAEQRDANNNLIQGLSNLKKLMEAGLGLDVLSNRDKIENILASIADSRVISQKVHGGAKVQASSTFFEQNPRVKVGDKYLSNELQFYPEEGEGKGYMEVYMPHYFKELFGDNPEDVANELLEAVGFRIPTSGLNVIERIKIKGFLPQSAGETIVLPTEIVAKAGSDFDVDKLNVLLPNYRMVKGKPEYIEFFENGDQALKVIDKMYKELETDDVAVIRKQLKKRGYGKLADMLIDKTMKTGKRIKNASKQALNTKQAYQNRLISISSQILSHKTNREALLTPIGIDVLDNLKQEIDDIRKETYESDYATMTTNFKYLTRITQRNIESIAGTGLSALHVSDHVHSTRYNYYMLKNFDLEIPHNQTESGRVSLAGAKAYQTSEKVEDIHKNEEIGDTLNQITNMFIDGVKNPISYSLNLNLTTAKTALYLIRAGTPVRKVMYLLNQPIVREYTKLKSIQESIANEPKWTDKKFEQLLTDQKIDKIIRDKYGKGFSPVDYSDTEMKDQLSSPTNGEQRSYLQEYLKAETGATELNKYIQSTRIDTQAMGKNTSQLELMLGDLEFINEKSSVVRNSDRVVANTMDKDTPGFLQPHYTALKEFKKLFVPFFSHYSNPDSNHVYENMVSFVSSLDGLVEDKVKLLDKVKADLLTYKLMTSPVMINNSQYGPIGGSVDKLMVDENSVPERVMKKRETSDNLFLEYLLPILSQENIEGKGYNSLKLVDQRLDIVEQNNLINEFRNLFVTDPQLAADITRFVILQSGLQLSPITFTKFIPQEYYSEMLGSVANAPLNKQQFIQRFIQNNTNDNLLLPIQWKRGKPDKAKLWKRLKRTGATKEELSQGFPKYKTKPEIVIPAKGLEIGELKVYPKRNSDYLINPAGFRDFKNDRSLQAYTLVSGTTPIIPEASQTVETIKRYDNKMVQANPDKIYIFGDNLINVGKGGQAIIRDNENAFGIPTKKKPANSESSFFTDTELKENILAIDKAIEDIQKDGRPIVFPSDGLGTGLANLEERAPETFVYLNNRLDEVFGFDNITGVVTSGKAENKALKKLKENPDVDPKEATKKTTKCRGN